MIFLKKFFFLFLFSSSFLHSLEKTEYLLDNEPIDVVIPCTEKDKETLELCIQGIRRYGENIRKIIVVSKTKLTDSAQWFEERQYPFSKEMIALEIFGQDEEKAAAFLNHPKTRIGWIYQQFLKLYAPLVIPGVSSNVLVLDADVVFLNPTSFMNENGEPFFTLASEYHEPYFTHMAHLLPGLKRVVPHSGVAHHMLFQRAILEELFNRVYKEHDVELWQAFCRCIDKKELYKSSFSEYETYMNFVLSTTDQAHIRSIHWANVPSTKNSQLKKYKSLGFQYVACHSYAREDPLDE